MVASGVLVAVAGILISSRSSGVAQSNIGPEYLLPALTAAFLGSTTIRPGRTNSIGTIIGVAIATIGISGLQQLLPGRFYLEPLFNGLTLVAAITIASLTSRRRVAQAKAAPVVATGTAGDEGGSDPPDVEPNEASKESSTDHVPSGGKP